MVATLVYYISSHGFGHAARSCEVLRQWAARGPGHAIVIRSAVPQWFFAEQLPGLAFTLRPGEFDCGVLGPDSNEADVARTVERAEALHAAAGAALAEEVAWLSGLARGGPVVVLSDVPSFALLAADGAGVPSLLVTNFHWPAIYRPLLDGPAVPAELRARGLALCAALQAEYDHGDVWLETEFSVPMRACRRQQRIGLIAPRGQSRRAELVRATGLDAARPIALIYVGREGLAGMHWAGLAGLAARYQFLAYDPPPAAAAWVRPLPRGVVAPADLSASVDLVVAKPGYGICAGCMATATPLLFAPRPQFIEAEAIERRLLSWGGALRIELDAFKACAWGSALDALRGRPRPLAVEPTGATDCLAAIDVALAR